ncbi:MAG: acetate--CoA ligase [Bacillota bacterium]
MKKDLPGGDSNHTEFNLTDYEKEYSTFSWESAEKEIGWEKGAPVNVAHSCIDRHAACGKGERTAMICTDGRKYTFSQLETLTNRFANLIKAIGVEKGERVALFLPACPEFYISLLGTVKAGAIAVPIHSQFMGDAVTGLFLDSQPALVVTSTHLRNRIPDSEIPSIRRIIVVGGGPGLDNWQSLVEGSDSGPATEWMDREDPMLLMYTSGSTGSPKGVIHVHGGAVQHRQTGHWALDLKEGDIYWCTADPAWITGVSYGVWAPWLNGVSILVDGSAPDPARCYSLLEKYRVSVWYTTPSFLRHLMSAGSSPTVKTAFKHLRKILSVGEPLNPIIIRWCAMTFGQQVYDSWWMTETGGIMITNFSCLPVKPGSMGKPVPGIYAAVVDEKGAELPPLEMGQLAIRAGWPAMMRGIWRDEEKYNEYFSIPPWYLTGDLAYRDHDGYFWFQGRSDDIIKVNSQRIGPFEIESKLAAHPAIAEAGVIGKPDPVKGEIIKAFIVLKAGFDWSSKLDRQIREFIKARLAPQMVPQEIEVCSSLPRTKNGKLLRRVLKSRELGLPTDEIN